MKVINFSDFRNRLAENLNAVNDDREIVVVSRSKGKNVVVMDLEEYNSIQETLHLTTTTANRERLTEAVREMDNGGGRKRKLIEK
ncbi:type II toxin-antitoxin system Phd/YefM family antitoxin [Flavitalea sp.]|nr:type II toxin-antitoxin system prevent-host-death family antitoxin [Flavitalea sp.]